MLEESTTFALGGTRVSQSKKGIEMTSQFLDLRMWIGWEFGIARIWNKGRGMGFSLVYKDELPNA